MNWNENSALTLQKLRNCDSLIKLRLETNQEIEFLTLCRYKDDRKSQIYDNYVFQQLYVQELVKFE